MYESDNQVTTHTVHKYDDEEEEQCHHSNLATGTWPHRAKWVYIKININTAHSESTKVQQRCSLPNKKKNKIKQTLGPVLYVQKIHRKKLGGKGGREVYKDIRGFMEEFVGPVWSPPCSKQPF